jgi:hypothetical protein
MKTFGLLNDCYWMLLDKLEDVMKHMNPIFYNHNEDYIIDSLSKGRLIAINHAGGFHAGTIEEYTNIQQSEGYPA